MKCAVIMAAMLAGALLGAGPALAQVDSLFRCGTSESSFESQMSSRLQQAALVQSLPGDSVVRARVVFVAFPGESNWSLPVWADTMVATLTDFISVMSRGAQRFDLSILRREDAPDSAWVAPYGSAHYDAMFSGWTRCNIDVMRQIAALDSTAWRDVDVVFMVHYECTFDGYGCSQEPCQGDCPIGGIADGAVPPDSVPGFTGTGTTQRIYYWPDINTPLASAAACWVAGHEYGHLLRMWHTSGSYCNYNNVSGCLADASFNNPGRYDLMRATGNAWVVSQGIVPYGAGQLAMSRIGWLPRVVVDRDTVGLHIPDLRSEGAFAVQVPVVNQPWLGYGQGRGQEWFLAVNDQGQSAYDQRYLSTGLLIWHASGTQWLGGLDPSSGVWDLECAVGKYADDTGLPDPVYGHDHLEANPWGMGWVEDFWGSSGKDYFTCSSNPNTNVYELGEYGVPRAPQDSATSVAFENVHRDSTTGDMVVDIFLDPKQFVTHPNGGEELSEGFADTITWAVRPHANITNVDVYFRPDAGMAYTLLASGQPNTGSFVWTPSGTGTRWRVRVVSHDGANGVATDESDQDFTVRDVRPPAAVMDLTVSALGRSTVTLGWSASGDDSLSGGASEYVIAHSTSAITAANFGSAAHDTVFIADSAGTSECATIYNLSHCTTYYFAIKAVDDAGNWSGLSNVPSGKTRCSGSTEVSCNEERMMAQGDAGGRWILEDAVLENSGGIAPESSLHQTTQATSAGPTGRGATTTSAWELGSAVATDTCRLDVPLEVVDGRVSVRLSPQGSRGWGLEGVGLAAVDHGVDEQAYLASGSVVVGVLAVPTAVTDTTSDLTSMLASGQQIVSALAGSIWDVTLGGDGTAALVLDIVAGAEGGGLVDGITVLTPDGSGGWQTLTTLYPGSGANHLAVDQIAGGHARLVFGSEYEVTRVARLDIQNRPALQSLTLVSAQHSRLGSVLGTLSAGSDSEVVVLPTESLVLGYQSPAVAAGQARDYFLMARGRPASTVGGASTRSTAPVAKSTILPVAFALHQNRPNPFHGSTTIHFDLPFASPVRLEVFDMQGRRVRTLADGAFAAGFQSVPWDQRNSSGRLMKPGVYLYRLQAGAFRAQRKMVLLP
jgi:hypothetical protein